MYTPPQQQMLQTWTEKRDALLREIGVLSVEYEALEKGNKEKGLALAELDIQISDRKGRLAELTALEERVRGSLPIDIAELEVRKSRLQSECTLLDEKLKGGADKYEIIVGATAQLELAHDTMKDQSVIVNKVVGEIIETSQAHISEMKVIMIEIKSVSDQVIEKGNENVKQTGIILEKLPKYIFELQRPIPIRRKYPAGHPNAPKE